MANLDNSQVGLDLSITGSGIDTSAVQKKGMLKQESTIVEELIAGKADYDLKDPSDIYRLKFNRDLTRKQKLAHY